MIQMHAVMSEWERDQISNRTKIALQFAKAHGVKLGSAGAKNLSNNLAKRKQESDAFVNNLAGIINGFKAVGMSHRVMVKELNNLNIRASKGGVWSLVQLQRVITKLP
jgi:DNA invertase Pin-like site-specific DNA recombinase